MIFNDFTQVNLHGFSDDESIWHNWPKSGPAPAEHLFAVGERPKGFERQWMTVGEARRKAGIQPASRNEFYNAMLALYEGDEFPW